MTTNQPWGIFRKNTVRRRLIGHYLARPGARHYLRELALLLRADAANLSRELAGLEAEGLFRCEIQGRLKYFMMNPDYPQLEVLKSLISQNASGGRLPDEEPLHRAYVIAGPNGAGKTTFARTFLTDVGCKVFINADLIAGGIQPLAPDAAALRAGKMLLEEIRRTAAGRNDFGFESTLSGRSYVHLFRQLAALGYGIHVIFLWLPNLKMSLKRIDERVRRGGHRIPKHVARRRFRRGIANLMTIYAPLVQSWSVFDNSGVSPELIAREEGGSRMVRDQEKFKRILKLAGVS